MRRIFIPTPRISDVMNKRFYILLTIFLLGFSFPLWADDIAKRTLPGVKEFPAPEFELPGEDGKTYRLSDFRGRVVVLNFWATWCPPCREEMPAMERAWQKVKAKGIVLVAVNVGEDDDQIFQFLGDFPVTFPILLDRKGEIVKRYPVIGLPTTFIIDLAGRVTHRAVGTRDWDHSELIGQLLKMVEKK